MYLSILRLNALGSGPTFRVRRSGFRVICHLRNLRNLRIVLRPQEIFIRRLRRSLNVSRKALMLRETKRGDPMYCPICATQNAEEKTVKMVTSIELPPRTKFCRSCGSNLTLVPQALTGRLPEAPSSRRRHRNRHHEDEGPATIANGITKAFMGVGFILVSFSAFLFAPAGRLWWFWLLIPAFAMLGKGVAEIVSARYARNLTQGATQSAVPPIARPGELPLHNDVRFPPPSVTEQTTRQLDPKTDPYRRRDTSLQ